MGRTVRQLVGDLEKALLEDNGNKSPVRKDSGARLAESNEILDNNTMPHDIIRGALERELDFIQDKFEELLGKQALKEVFARRASALSDSVLAGMASHEITEPQKSPPPLTEDELAEFKAHAAVHPWDKRKCSPAQHIETQFQKWLGRGLRRAHITALPGTLGRAYATEVRRHPERRVAGLFEEPYRLPAGAPRPPSVRLMAELSEEEQQKKRRRNLEAQRRFRKNHAPAA
jgi:hypothetical protein